MRNKFKELDNWVVSYNQPPDAKRYPAIPPKKIRKRKGKVSKNPGLRENETK